MPNGVKLRFKSERIKIEWPLIHPDLQVAVLDIANYANTNYQKPVVITCAVRSKEEQAALKGVPDSLHLTMPCRAVDLRKRGFSDEEVQSMKSYFYGRYPKNQGWDFIPEGPPYNRRAPHIHIEYGWKP